MHKSYIKPREILNVNFSFTLPQSCGPGVTKSWYITICILLASITCKFVLKKEILTFFCYYYINNIWYFVFIHSFQCFRNIFLILYAFHLWQYYFLAYSFMNNRYESFLAEIHCVIISCNFSGALRGALLFHPLLTEIWH